MRHVDLWCTKEFLLLKRDQIKFVEVPLYEEFTVKSLYELVAADDELLKYLPELKDAPAKAPPREFCFNVVNTLTEGYIEKAVEQAKQKRAPVAQKNDERHRPLNIHADVRAEILSVQHQPSKFSPE